MKIFITGASSGIGLAITEQLLKEDHEVIGASRKAPSLQHSLFEYLPLDLSKTFNERDIAKRYMDIDVLILSAGMAHFGHLEQLSSSKMEEIMRVNFTSQALLIKGFLPFLKQKEHSDIIVIGSECSLQGKKRASIYSSSKFAMRGFVQSLQEECQQTPVRVSMLQPGLVDTPFYKKECFIPDKKSLTASEIADTVIWLFMQPSKIHIPEISISPKHPSVIWKGTKKAEAATSTLENSTRYLIKKKNSN